MVYFFRKTMYHKGPSCVLSKKKDLVKHFPVLGCNTYMLVKTRVFFHCQDQRTKFDRLRPCTKYKRNLFHFKAVLFAQGA